MSRERMEEKMKYVALTLFVVIVSLMTGCAGMTCPMSKKSQVHQTTQDYAYEFKVFGVNNLSSSVDLEREMNKLNIKIANAEVVSVSVMPDQPDNGQVRSYTIVVTYKRPIEKK